jgi:hypothetical protein
VRNEWLNIALPFDLQSLLCRATASISARDENAVENPRPGDTFGRYAILGELGRGGMGVVLRARQIDLEREVALKVLAAELADQEEFAARFRREASLLASVDSPHIIAVYDHGEFEGRLFIATQLVKGGDLAQHLRQHGPLTLDQGLDLTAQLASALGDAHTAGVLHRDVKPSNVLLHQTPDGWHAYLCDFGIAHTGAAELTQAGTVVGTYGYLAPERCEGHPATVESDLYALGCLLVAALSGTAPYAGSDFQVARQHLTAPIPQWDPTFPGSAELNQILQRAMAKNPQDRYHSATDMRRDLLTAHQNAHAPQRPPTPTVARPAIGAPAPERTVMRAAPSEPVHVGASPSGPAAGRRTEWRGKASVVAVAALLLAVLVTGGYLALHQSSADHPAAVAGADASKGTGPSPSPSSAGAASRRAPTPAGATTTVTKTPTAAAESFEHGALPCSDGEYVIALTGGLSASSSYADVTSAMSRFPTAGGVEARYATTADACPSLTDVATGMGRTLPPSYPYIGPFPSAAAACQARLDTDRSTYVTETREGAVTTVRCPCQISVEALPQLSEAEDGNAVGRDNVWVAGLQNLLYAAGSAPGSLVPGINNEHKYLGVFGDQTDGWVKQVQQAYDLPPNGVVDTETWKAIRTAAGCEG